MVHKKIMAKITANKWKSAFVGFALLLILGFVSGMVAIGGVTTPAMSKEASAGKAIDYINRNVLNGAATARLESVSESNGLYLIKLSIAGRSYDSYITKDGKLLFPSAINLAEIATTSTPQAAFDAPDSEKPNVRMFVMSFCPYGQQAEAGLAPVHALLGDRITIEPHFVIYGDYQGGSAQYCMANGTLCSMHGIGELNEDIRQMCIYKYYGATKFWDYVAKINSNCNSRDADTCWDGIAKTIAGIDTEKIKACQKDEGAALMTKEKELNEKYGVRGSPTIFVNEQQYSGDRSAEGLKQAVCSGFSSSKPSECSQAITGGQDSANTHPGDAGCGG